MQNIHHLKDKMVKVLQLNSVDDAPREVNLLISYVLQVPPRELCFSPSITKKQYQKLLHLIKRRIKREPRQYILKNVEFYGLNFYIKKGVFIPRPETEILVEETIQLVSDYGFAINIAEIGCGSGCIAIALAKNIDNCFIYAIDISPLSLSCARRNAQKHEVEKKIKFREGEYLSPLKNLKNEIDVVIFNPPYIPTSDIPLLQKEVLQEPREAIDGGKQGLDFYKSVVSYIPDYIKNNGFIITEIGINQKDEVSKIFFNKNFYLHKVVPDYSGIDRVLIFKATK